MWWCSQFYATLGQWNTTVDEIGINDTVVPHFQEE